MLSVPIGQLKKGITVAKPRRDSLDFIRVLAITLVLIVHTRGYFFSPSNFPLTFAILRVLGTTGVPLFVMLTGYLMVDRPYDDPTYLHRFAQRNLLTLVVAFECWNLVWFVLGNIPNVSYPGGGFPVSLGRTIKVALFVGDTGTALWYLPMTIALYLGLPIVSIAGKRLAKNSPDYAKTLFLLLVIFGTVVPSAKTALGYFGHGDAIHSVLIMNIFGASVWGDSVWLLYLIIGALIAKERLRLVTTKNLLLFGIVIPIVTSIAIQYLFPDVTLTSYSFIGTVVPSAALFEFLDRHNADVCKLGQLFPACIRFLSKLSFSVYMLHLFVFGWLYHAGLVVSILAFPMATVVPAYLLFTLALMFLSAGLGRLLGTLQPVAKWMLLLK